MYFDSFYFLIESESLQKRGNQIEGVVSFIDFLECKEIITMWTQLLKDVNFRFIG